VSKVYENVHWFMNTLVNHSFASGTNISYKERLDNKPLGEQTHQITSRFNRSEIAQDIEQYSTIWKVLRKKNFKEKMFPYKYCMPSTTSSVKGTVSRDFSCLVFFHQTTSPSPNRHAQERFWIFSNIRGVIRICNRLPGDEYTGESIRIL
jgi:hypothetical protein